MSDTPLSQQKLPWEPVAEGLSAVRLKVHLGWLVRCGPAMGFLPDAYHEWHKVEPECIGEGPVYRWPISEGWIVACADALPIFLPWPGHDWSGRFHP